MDLASSPRSRRTSSATAFASSATRWRCRSADGPQVPRRVRRGDRPPAGPGSRFDALPDASPRDAGARRPDDRDHLDHRRPRGDRERGRNAPRRGARRRRDPGLLLRAEARRAGRSLPDVPGRDRGDPETPDLLLDAGSRRDGRPHPHRPGQNAQSAVVEFLLVNHPLDCPVCDKGGECPLQDITMGWGPGHTRFIDAKRHFQKPVELSPLVAIDRERCILCYRCVRFSQEVAEDEQLQLLERGDRTFVGTFDDRPYIAPFHGNITDLCPVGALTSYTYRFRARPWDIENARLGLHALPEPVQRQLHRPRRGGEAGPRPRQPRRRRRLALRPAAATASRCSPPRSGSPRRGCGAAREASWAEAIEKAAAGLKAARRRQARRSSATPPTRRATWSSGSCARRSARRTSTRGLARRRPRRARSGSPTPSSRPGSATSTTPTSILVVGTDPLHTSPILDLRIRKAIRRNGTRLAVATDRPTALDGGAEAIARYAPGEAAAFLGGARRTRSATTPRTAPTPVAETLRGRRAGRDRLGRAHRPRRRGRVEALLEVAAALGRAEKDGSGPARSPRARQRPRPARGRLPPRRRAGAGRGRRPAGARGDPHGAREGELRRWSCSGSTRSATSPTPRPGKRALAAADHLVAFSTFENQTTAMADVVFPIETHAEKDGTVTHPEGRLQRVRPSASRPGDIRPNWGVLAELSLALGHDTGISSQPDRLRRARPKPSRSTPGSPTPRSAAAESGGRTDRRPRTFQPPVESGDPPPRIPLAGRSWRRGRRIPSGSGRIGTSGRDQSPS